MSTSMKPGAPALWIALVFGLTIFTSAALVTRVHRSGEAALAASERAFDAGDLSTATDFARESLTWYLPGAPHVTAAAERLRAIAIGAEATGDAANALRAWAALRGALFETSHPWSTADELFREASAGVSRLLLLQNVAAKGISDEHTELEKQLKSAYEQPPRETGRDWFASAASLGMALMLLCGSLLLSRSLLNTAAALFFVRAGLLTGVGIWLIAAVGY